MPRRQPISEDQTEIIEVPLDDSDLDSLVPTSVSSTADKMKQAQIDCEGMLEEQKKSLKKYQPVQAPKKREMNAQQRAVALKNLQKAQARLAELRAEKRLNNEVESYRQEKQVDERLPKYIKESKAYKGRDDMEERLVGMALKIDQLTRAWDQREKIEKKRKKLNNATIIQMPAPAPAPAPAPRRVDNEQMKKLAEQARKELSFF